MSKCLQREMGARGWDQLQQQGSSGGSIFLSMKDLLRLAPAQHQPAGVFRHVPEGLHLAAEHRLSKTSCLCYFQALRPLGK